MKLKTLSILATIATIQMTASALAADLPSKGPYPQNRAMALFDWSGFVLGADIGYGMGSADSAVSFGGGCCSANTDPKGWLYGGYIGVQRHYTSGIVLGVQASLAKTDFNDTVPVSGFPTIAAKSKMDYLGLAELKIGYAMGRVLPYATVGAAFARSNMTLAGGGGSVKSNDFDSIGWTVGLGLDYAVYDSLILGIKYAYADLGSKDAAFPVGGGVGISVPVDQKVSTLKASIGWKY